ncbi:hypothetical protein [Nocardia aurantiaca]|uniref:Secreted protein n=1 Tax=Nocardia aurantiaca TaxID=2675850 RepID=A0A6I3KS75_9NOCA|nr:hypothetical protein [Nocardia aurantiaca]MTE11410.1 hypothetical protein [Nocardia aurantiaca]
MNSKKKILGAFAVSAALLTPAALLAAPAQADPLPLTAAQPVDTTGPATGSSNGSYSAANYLVCILFHTSLNGSVGIPFC